MLSKGCLSFSLEMAAPFFMDLLQEFLDYLRYERNQSEKTIENYTVDLEQYILCCAQSVGEEYHPSEGDKDLIRSWLSSLIEEGYKASSVQRKLSAVKSFYRYLLKKKIIDKNPATFIRCPKVEKPLPSVLNEGDMRLLLEGFDEACTDFETVRDQLILEMLFDTGLRRSELASLQMRNVDLARMTLKILGKGSKERWVPFGNALKRRMQQYLRLREEKIGMSEDFFVSLKNKTLSGEDVYRVVHRKLSLFPDLARQSPHVLRHTFATVMLNRGADLMAVKELLGHSKVATTVRYTHSSLSELKKVYNAHPRAIKGKSMNVRIQAVHFTLGQELEAFVQKKLDRLDRLHDGVMGAEVTLKLLSKAEGEANKEASIRLQVAGPDLFAAKSAATFEEAVDMAVDAIKKQAERLK